MAGEHVNVLMAGEAPATRLFVVDHRESHGWVEMAECGSLEEARELRDQMVAQGLPADEIRIRGERGERLGMRVWMTILTILAVVNAVLYAAVMTAD